MSSTSRSYFEQMYRNEDDPWGFRDKSVRTAQVCADRRLFPAAPLSLGLRAGMLRWHPESAVSHSL